MTAQERRILIVVWCAAAIVFSFLAGFVASGVSWFEPAKKSLLSWLNME